MTAAVDTNILLDVLIPNTPFLDTSLEALEKARTEGRLILGEAVYAELASQFDTREEVEAFLQDTGIQLVPATPEALYLASRAWNAYEARRQEGLVCPACGRIQPLISCASRGHSLRMRQHIISDFLIGAHASVLADRLLTRDRGFYGRYFTPLRLVP